MAKAVFNIGEGFKEVFGRRIPLFGDLVFPKSNELPKYGAAESQVEAYQDATDRVAPGTGLLLADRIRFVDGSEEYKLPHESVWSYHRAKNIVKTALQGRDGTVKEYIAMDDWQITIQGFLIDYENMSYPIDQVNTMRKWFEKNRELEVVSDWLTTLEIFNVVVTDIDLPSYPGFANVQPFELMLISDEPVELKLIAA